MPHRGAQRRRRLVVTVENRVDADAPPRTRGRRRARERPQPARRPCSDGAAQLRAGGERRRGSASRFVCRRSAMQGERMRGPTRCASSSSTTRRWRARCCASTWPPMPDVEIVAECANGFEAVKAVAERRPTSCCSTCRCRSSTASRCWSWSAATTPVIFVTAYDEFALRAFEVHAVDYLLKPVSAERLAEALARVRVRRRGSRRRRRSRRCGRRSASAGRPSAILVRDGPRVHVIAGRRARLRAGAGRLCVLHAQGKEYLKEQPLGRGRSRARSRAPSSASIARSSSTWRGLPGSSR